MDTHIREEITWLKDKDYMLTSVIIWNEKYLPFQMVLFRKDNHDKIEIRMFTKVEDMIYMEENLLGNFRTDQEEEIVYQLLNSCQRMLNVYTVFDKEAEKRYHKDDYQLADKLETNLVDALLLDDSIMDMYKEAAPEIGFYSLAVNFNKMKKAIENQELENLYNDFIALSQKYN
ncbi:MAG: hypothetical protein RQ856_05515, partial [Candidatus Izemoplasmatales bacterium]|nr:hypothetical protein [Candidatus Izemoplasmatales bacterium]